MLSFPAISPAVFPAIHSPLLTARARHSRATSRRPRLKTLARGVQRIAWLKTLGQGVQAIAPKRILAAGIMMFLAGAGGGGAAFAGPSTPGGGEGAGAAAAGLLAGAKGATVVLIVMDAARADAFSFYGGAAKSTPNLARLAAESLVFDGAIAPASYTVASLGSLHTGRFPLAHGLLLHENRLSLGETTLAERLAAAGYHTIGVAGTSNGSSQYAFDQGFETWREVFHHDPIRERPAPFDPRRTSLAQASLVTAAIPRPLRTSPDTPVFLYLHFREPHAPYLVPPEAIERFGGKGYEGALAGDATSRLLAAEEGKTRLTARDRRFVHTLYDASLWVVDRAIGEVLDRLREEGLYEQSILIVTADHGEELFEHGHWGHSRQLYDESTHIPLLIRLPEACGVEPRRIASLVTLTDLLPTITDLLSLPPPEGVADGKSLVDLLAGEGPAAAGSRAIASITYPARGIHHDISLRMPRWKYLWRRGGGEELYDLGADPREKHNLAAAAARAGSIRVARIRARQWMGVWKERKRKGEERPPLTPEEEEQLRALGYLGSEPAPEESAAPDASHAGAVSRPPEDLVERYLRFERALDPLRVVVREAAWTSGRRGARRDEALDEESLHTYRLVRAGNDRYEVRYVEVAGEALQPEVYCGISGEQHLYREAGGKHPACTPWEHRLREPFFAGQLLLDIGSQRLDELLRIPCERIPPPRQPEEEAHRIGLRFPVTPQHPLELEVWFDPRYPFPVAASATRPGAIRPFESYEVEETGQLPDGTPVPVRIRRRWASGTIPPPLPAAAASTAGAGAASTGAGAASAGGGEDGGGAGEPPSIGITYEVAIEAWGKNLSDADVQAARREVWGEAAVDDPGEAGPAAGGTAAPGDPRPEGGGGAPEDPGPAKAAAPSAEGSRAQFSERSTSLFFRKV